MELTIQVRYRVVSDLFRETYIPYYASTGAAGMDLHACIRDRLSLEPGKRVRVPTGIALQWGDPSVVGLVYARSGLAWRHGIGLPNGVGVIDSDFTGEIQVLLTNFSDETVDILPGDRIAQIVFTPVRLASLVQVTEFSETERGDRGFGSTGIS